ncbi:MAG: YceI family protein [Anaerolineales bacterium]|jgi:polyisoprenoid-binding protein YceI
MSWKIDTAHSEINFSVRHMMIATVRGRFEKFSGAIDFNENEPARSRVEVQIEASSINTREPQRDAHLKSPDFFDVENFPFITFKGKSIDVKGDNQALITGDLTIRDVTRQVVLDAEYAGMAQSPFGATNAGFSASTRINRKDWGLTWNVALETGGMLVADEIKIDIDLEIIKQAEAEPELALA